MMRIISAFFAVVALTMAMPAAAKESYDKDRVAELCAKVACRTNNYQAVVWIDATHFQEVPVNPAPYVDEDGEILIFPGETFAVQFPIDGDKLGVPVFYKAFAPHFPAKIEAGGRPVDNPNDASLPAMAAASPVEELAGLPDNVMVISYGQADKSYGMFMNIEHNLGGKLKLDAVTMIIKPGDYEEHYTSTCPIESKLGGIEMWPYPIGPMLLSNFRLLKATDDQDCK